jgi:rhodanese-related sulfurtransferase
VVKERHTVAAALAGFRSRIERIDAATLAETPEAVVVDTRDANDRHAEGVIPGSIPIPLSVLLWRADPDSPSRDDRIADLDARVVVVCNDGYSSSWAAAELVSLGFARAGDLIGGHRAWVAAGLPVEPAG